MDLNLFDVDVTLGTPSVPLDSENGYFRSEEEILALMDRFGIEQAVVRHTYSREYSATHGNQILDQIESKRIERCHTLLPPYTGEMGSGDKIIEHLEFRIIRFVTFYPTTHNYHFSAHTCGSLLGGLADAGIIVLLEADQIDYERVYELCRHIPELHLVLLGVGYRDNRDIYPLLEGVDNVMISTSRFCGMGFIEDVVQKFGPHRLVFSSGMPIYTPGAPLTSLSYADIDPEYKSLIAGNTIRSLLGDIDESY